MTAVTDVERRTYTCAVCGRVDVWRRGWQWWPRFEPGWTHTLADPTPDIIVCSDACRQETGRG